MKRLLPLLLTVSLLFTLLSVSCAAFSDDSAVAKKYGDTVTAMSEKGIIAGFSDGSFKPQGTLTRAQAAKIICCILEGADKSAALSDTATVFPMFLPITGLRNSLHTARIK